MNERIRQLAEQAGCKVMDDGEWYIPSATGLEKIVYTKGIGLEKFAELIVQECGLWFNNRLVVEPDYGIEHRIERNRAVVGVMKEFNQHFGVAE
jgi:hypothetical protein